MGIDERILRINQLAKKSREQGLNEEEKNEQKQLRADYIKGFRDGLKQTLDNTYIMDQDGNKNPIKKK